MQHHIKKQVINLRVTNKKDAYRMQQLVSDLYRKEMVPVIDRAFNEISNEKDILKIDKLVIDLGLLRENDFQKRAWAETLFNQLKEKLRLLKHMPATDMEMIIRPVILNNSDQWLFYMQEGRLPWNMLEIDPLWLENVLQAFATDITAIRTLRKRIQNSPGMAERIVIQHGEKFLVSLLEVLTAKTQIKIPVILNELTELIVHLNGWNRKSRKTKEKLLRRQIWRLVILYAAKNEPDSVPEKITEYLLNLVHIRKRLSPDIPVKFLAPSRLTGTLIRELVNRIGKQDSAVEIRDKNSGEDYQLKNKNSGDSTENLKPERKKKKTEEQEERLDGETLSSEEKVFPKKIGEESIYAPFAGLVLLHPFLADFFRKLNLLEKNAFTDRESKQKALFLLYYLATGTTEAAEHELVIPKLLCDYPLQMPVYEEITLSEKERSEADELLDVVIQYWNILKDTSAEGLREGFLQRNGRLSVENEKQVILIERMGIDILLDDLPWNLGLIQLPWKKELIRVDWS